MKPLRSYILRGAGACAVIATSLVGVSSHAGASGSTVNVVGYSIVGPAYTALENAFLQTPAGQNFWTEKSPSAIRYRSRVANRVGARASGHRAPGNQWPVRGRPRAWLTTAPY